MVDLPINPETVDRSVLAKVFKDPRSIVAFEAIQKAALQQNPDQINQNTADIAALLGAPFIAYEASSELTAERVLTGSTGVTIDLSMADLVKIVVDVIEILGYTPANKAGDTFTGDVKADAKFEATGNVLLDALLGVTGAASFSDNVTIAKALTVTLALTALSTLQVNGAATLGSLVVNGFSLLNGSLSATGNIAASGNVTAITNLVSLGNCNVSGSVNAPAGNFTNVNGSSTVTGDVVSATTLLRGGNLRVDQTPAATTTASDHSIPINCNGTVYYLRLSATP